jgi:hypothetical protein
VTTVPTKGVARLVLGAMLERATPKMHTSKTVPCSVTGKGIGAYVKHRFSALHGFSEQPALSEMLSPLFAILYKSDIPGVSNQILSEEG